ncbi:MAG: DUF6364 family protein [Flavisolibacter sp.]
MTQKLTLSVDKNVVDAAKKYAGKRGKSLSRLVENYLRTISTEEKDHDISPKVKKLMGAVKLSKSFDYKKELSKAIQSKHG